MNTMDYVQLAMLLLALLVALCGALNRWAVANHRDRLAAFTSAAGNAAGRIRQELLNLPAGADVQQVKKQMLEYAADELMAEFNKNGPKIGATTTKAVGMIEGQLGQLPTIVVAGGAA